MLLLNNVMNLFILQNIFIVMLKYKRYLFVSIFLYYYLNIKYSIVFYIMIFLFLYYYSLQKYYILNKIIIKKYYEIFYLYFLYILSICILAKKSKVFFVGITITEYPRHISGIFQIMKAMLSMLKQLKNMQKYQDLPVWKLSEYYLS